MLREIVVAKQNFGFQKRSFNLSKRLTERTQKFAEFLIFNFFFLLFFLIFDNNRIQRKNHLGGCFIMKNLHQLGIFQTNCLLS